jgi:hypothetical protein
MFEGVRRLTEVAGTQQTVEVRAFGQLKKVFDQRGWDFPSYYPLQAECSALELAGNMELPLEEIEAVFVNGVASPIDQAMVTPGDRVGFIPLGIPGPYRVMLGMVKLPEDDSEKQ